MKYNVYLNRKSTIINIKSTRSSGDYSNRVPPLPIPNREVKHVSANGTAFVWESRSSPNF